MARREREVVVSARVRPDERARIRALAELEGMSVAALLHELLVPAVDGRLQERVARR